MPSFFDGMFAVAGVAAAAGPSSSTCSTAAAFAPSIGRPWISCSRPCSRNRRILQLRDLLLLAAAHGLRRCCLVWPRAPVLSASDAVAGLGQARACGARRRQQPEHGLPAARRHAARRSQGQGPRVPRSACRTAARSPCCRCAARRAVQPRAYRTKEDARDALDKIDVVDRQGTLPRRSIWPGRPCQGARLAGQARGLSSAISSRSIGRPTRWPSSWRDLPELQIVPSADDEPKTPGSPTSRLHDGIADVETSTVFLAKIRYRRPPAPRRTGDAHRRRRAEWPANPSIWKPGQDREVTFHYRFDVAAEPGRAVLSTAIGFDPARPAGRDDDRVAGVPVVAALPVVFVDQYGRRRPGPESLRRNASPAAAAGPSHFAWRHDPPIGGGAACENRPGRSRQPQGRPAGGDRRRGQSGGSRRRCCANYVEQGGQLVIAAGGDFDPAAWNEAAWLDGAGILPAPLKPQMVGKTPEEATGDTMLKPFFISFPSVAGNDYLPAGQHLERGTRRLSINRRSSSRRSRPT